MGDLATVEDLAAYKGLELAKPDTAAMCVRLASAAVRAAARQMLSLVIDDTIQLHPQAAPAQINLPERPVWGVKTIILSLSPGIEDGSVVTNYEVTKWGRVRWPLGDFQGGIMAAAINAPTLEVEYSPLVTVTYTHGYPFTSEDVPDPNPLEIVFEPDKVDLVKSVVLAAAARAYENPEGFTSEQIGTGYVGAYGDARGLTLTDDEKATLAPFRRSSWGGAGS